MAVPLPFATLPGAPSAASAPLAGGGSSQPLPLHNMQPAVQQIGAQLNRGGGSLAAAAITGAALPWADATFAALNGAAAQPRALGTLSPSSQQAAATGTPRVPPAKKGQDNTTTPSLISQTPAHVAAAMLASEGVHGKTLDNTPRAATSALLTLASMAPAEATEATSFGPVPATHVDSAELV